MSVHWSGAIAPLAPEWEALAEHVRASPFLRPGWIAAWWRAYGRGQLAILAARRDKRLVGRCHWWSGVARCSRRRTGTQWTMGCWQPTRRRAGSWRRRRWPIRREDWNSHSWMPPERISPTCIDATREAGHRFVLRTIERSCIVHTAGDWCAFENQIPASRRSDLRRCRRRISELGDLTLEVHTGERGVAALQEAVPLEATGWKGNNGTAIVSRSSTLRFYGEVAQWASGRGWLRTCVLRVAGRPIAFHLVLVAHGSAYHLKSGYDVELPKHSPGMLILHDVLRQNFADESIQRDHLGGAEPYKVAWPVEIRPRMVPQSLFAFSVGGR